MEKYYLRHHRSQDDGINIVFDQNFQAVYLVTGRLGKKDDQLTVQSMSGEVLVRLRQLSYGLIPRFEISSPTETVASLNFHLGYFGDLIFVHQLNWMISGNFLTNHYVTYHLTKRLLSVKPELRPDGLYNQLTVLESNDDLPIHIAIAALLDLWSLKTNKINLALQRPFVPLNSYYNNFFEDSNRG